MPEERPGIDVRAARLDCGLQVECQTLGTRIIDPVTVDGRVIFGALVGAIAWKASWLWRFQVRVGPGHKGPHVTEVLTVDSTTAVPMGSRQSSARATPLNGPSAEKTGTVKWFNPERGYGFIALNDGGKDVFVHVSALERSGIDALSEGQTVVVDIVDGRKGPEAARVRLI